MRYPTLRYPRLCRFTVIAVALGKYLLPMGLVLSIPSIPAILRVAVMIGCPCAAIFYLLRNMITLLEMDTILETLACYKTARTQYEIPFQDIRNRIENKIAHYGKKCTPKYIQPQPADLRYKFSYPWTIYSCGIERVAAVYHTDILDDHTYQLIFKSGIANSKALIRTKKSWFLDKEQKKAPLNRVTVLVIFAKQIESRLRENLYEQLCQQCGTGVEEAVLPCIIDLSRNICIFNSLRLPYIGFEYAAKNRGIRMIRKFVLGGRLPLKNNSFFVPQEERISTDQSLWTFWRRLKIESGDAEKEINQKLKNMSHKEIRLEDEILYLKWEDQGVVLFAEQKPEEKIIVLEEFQYWTYPKNRSITKKVRLSVQQEMEEHFKKEGWTAVWGEPFGMER